MSQRGLSEMVGRSQMGRPQKEGCGLIMRKSREETWEPFLRSSAFHNRRNTEFKVSARLRQYFRMKDTLKIRKALAGSSGQ